MSDTTKPQRPTATKRLLRDTYLSDELKARSPLRDLMDYYQEVETWNRNNSNKYQGEKDKYVPEELRDVLRITPVGTTEGEVRWDDFVPPGTIVKLNASYNHGEVDHDAPRTIKLGTARPSTLFHEAAHVDSLTNSPVQAYFMGNRMYPGYSSLVGNAAKNTNDKYYEKSDYGGYEEDAARLRAAYAMSPPGTSFGEFFKDSLDMGTLKPVEIYDKTSKDGDIVERRSIPSTKDDALRMLEHTLFPRMRFLEENKNTVSTLQKIKDWLDTVKKPIGDMYKRGVKQ